MQVMRSGITVAKKSLLMSILNIPSHHDQQWKGIKAKAHQAIERRNKIKETQSTQLYSYS
jgi:hypothetical protein